MSSAAKTEYFLADGDSSLLSDTLSLKPIYDTEVIKSVMLDDEIWDRISEDGNKKEGV